jgi:hypothetical protein
MKTVSEGNLLQDQPPPHPLHISTLQNNPPPLPTVIPHQRFVNGVFH